MARARRAEPSEFGQIVIRFVVAEGDPSPAGNAVAAESGEPVVDESRIAERPEQARVDRFFYFSHDRAFAGTGFFPIVL